MYYVYFLKSLSNDKVYVGFTEKEPEIRLTEHLSGSNALTRQNGPMKLLYHESFYCKKDAIARERFYKTGFGRLKRNVRSHFSCLK